MATQTCPDREVLIRFNAGRLPRDSIDRVAIHVSTCSTCQQLLTSIDSANEDKLAKKLRGVGIGQKMASGASGESNPVSAAAAVAQSPSRLREIVALFEQAALESVSAGSRSQSAWGHLPARLGQYRILAPLRAGGMGAVVKAEHSVLKRIVALKLLPADRFRDPRAITRFQREIEAIARLDHPHIVRASDAGEHDGIHFLVMDLVDGLDLSTIVHQIGPLRVADACELIRQTSLALQHAHEHGLVHRDVKPSNIMLDVSGQAKLLDLGLARLGDVPQTTSELTDTGQLLGTFDYMAPEQATDLRNVDIRADLYSLGCTLYFLLSGRAPFNNKECDTVVKKILAHAKEAVEPLRAVRPDAPEALARIVSRLLEKSPARRFAEPRELADALAPLCGGADLHSLLSKARTGSPVNDPPNRRSTERLSAMQMETPRDSLWPASPAPEPRMFPRARTGARKGSRWIAACLALIIFGAAAWWSLPAIIRVVTGTGVLEIEPLDADVEVRVLHNGEKVQLLDTKTNRKVELLAGKYELQLGDGGDDLRLLTDNFTLARGDVELVRITHRSIPAPAEPGAVRPAVQPATPNESTAKSLADRWPEGQTAGNPGGLPGLVPFPARLPNVNRWQLETAEFRTGVRCAAWSPDKKYIACAANYAGASRLYILDAAAHRLVRLFAGNGDVKGTAWSPDGQRIVGIGPDHRAQIWSVADGKPVQALAKRGAGFRGTIFNFHWSPDGKWITAVTDDEELGLWNASDGSLGPVIARHAGGVRAAAFSPDGRWVASVGEDATLRLWNLADGQPGRNFSAPQGRHPYTDSPWWLALHPEGRPMALAFSPDGRRLAVGANSQVQIWNVPDGSPGPALGPDVLKQRSVVSALSFSPDGTTLVVGLWVWSNSAELRLFSANTLEPGPTYPVSADVLTWHPDGRQLGVATQFSRSGFSVYEFANSPAELKLSYTLGSDRLAPWKNPRWTSDGQGLVLVSDDRVMVWDVNQMRPRRLIATPPSHTRSRAVSPRGDRLAAGGYQGTIRIINLNTGDVESTFSAADNAVGYLAWSPDEKMIAGTSGRENSVQEMTVWRLDGTEQRRIGPTSGYFIYWSPDGKWIATRGPRRQALQLWDAATGQAGRLLEPPDLRGVHHVAWSADGRYVATGSGNYELVHVWDVNTGNLVMALPDTNNVAIYALAFSPDGQWLAGGGGHNATELCVWRVGQWDLRHRMVSHWSGLGGIAWHPNSRQLATSGEDGLLQSWTVPGRLDALAVLFDSGTAASFTAAGQTIYADPETENELVYLVEGDGGRIDLLRPAKFLERIRGK